MMKAYPQTPKKKAPGPNFADWCGLGGTGRRARCGRAETPAPLFNRCASPGFWDCSGAAASSVRGPRKSSVTPPGRVPGSKTSDPAYAGAEPAYAESEPAYAE
ncbi:MAG: hypothetical protein AMXMBFR47_02500 [Planctomycetota bacterium]